MRPFWPEAEFLARTLMMMVRGVDDDGVDFYVTDNTVSKTATNDPGKIRKAMNEAEPNANSLDTDMNAALGRIFSDRLEKLRYEKRYGRKIKKMTLIVLTDGVWRGTI